MGSYEGGGYNLGSNSAGYMDPSDPKARNLTQMKDEFYNSNYPGQSAHWVQGSIDKRFKVGDQFLYNLIYGNNSSQAQKFFLNMIRRHINMICGYQRKNRKSTIAIPLNDDADQLADDFNKVMRWTEDRDGYQEYQSQAFEGSCDTGMTLLWGYLDYALDPYGDFFTDCVAYNNFLIDQYFRKQDLSDCNGIWRRRWTSKNGAKMLVPGYAKEIDKMKPGGMKDGRFPLQAELQNVAINNLFTYDEFHYRTTREAKMVIDPYTKEGVEWEQDDDDADDLMEQTLRQQPWLQVKKMQIPTCNMVISIGGKNIYDGPNQLGLDIYPCVPSICYHEPDMQSYSWRLMGVIRNLRDPQFLYNMRKCIELNILQTQINSGWIFSTDAVVDVKAFRQSGEGFIIPLKAGHLPNEIQRIEPSAIPQSLLELSNGLSEDITKISGVNEELLGSATDDKSGILSMLRQGAGLVTLQTIFDKLDYTQRLFGKLRLQAIRKNFSKQKIKNILGHDPDPRFFTSHSQKYSIGIEEGNYSTSQRQTELTQLLHFKELGIPISSKSIVRAAFITNKKLVMQEMEEEQQAQAQQAQAEAQKQEKLDNAKIMGMFSKSKVDIAKEQETYASAQEKLAKVNEINSMAEHNSIEADLNMVKLAMELEDVQFNQLSQAWQFKQAMKAAEQPQTVAQ
jgi:hypothetical protein